jgi:hypothetical protein
MTPEGEILKSILAYLSAEKILAFRMNSGAIVVDKRFIRFGSPGMADIICFPSRCDLPAVAWIECKTAKGRQSENQKWFQKLVEAEAHVYILARSINDVRDVLG